MTGNVGATSHIALQEVVPRSACQILSALYQAMFAEKMAVALALMHQLLAMQVIHAGVNAQAMHLAQMVPNLTV